MEQMHEISFERINDGSIRLEQQSGHGERDVILLHPEQLQFIARRLCGMGSATAAKIEDVERKLSVLTDRLERIVDDKWFRKGLVEECGDGIEMMARLDALVDLAIEMDGGRLLPTGTQTQAATSSLDSKSNADASVQAESADTNEGVSQLGLDV